MCVAFTVTFRSISRLCDGSNSLLHVWHCYSHHVWQFSVTKLSSNFLATPSMVWAGPMTIDKCSLLCIAAFGPTTVHNHVTLYSDIMYFSKHIAYNNPQKKKKKKSHIRK